MRPHRNAEPYTTRSQAVITIQFLRKRSIETQMAETKVKIIGRRRRCMRKKSEMIGSQERIVYILAKTTLERSEQPTEPGFLRLFWADVRCELNSEQGMFTSRCSEWLVHLGSVLLRIGCTCGRSRCACPMVCIRVRVGTTFRNGHPTSRGNGNHAKHLRRYRYLGA